ncbi:hypothetical protein [Bdellovibrio sp. BCCA]|uniref:hypothetical protein n=1 Tax=Bdellovibrio sp. BCCA TaxID=3136281 RepID=UPI0030F2BE75
MKFFAASLSVLFVFFCSSTWATMKFIYHAPESSSDSRYDFHWKVLREILETTSAKYGPYEMHASVFMTEDRQISEIQKKHASLTVMIRETDQQMEKILIPVRIPIDRNLLGYRVFLIKDSFQKHFDKWNSLEDLKQVPLGQGQGWGDIKILEKAGFKVLTEIYYDDLFKHLSTGRYLAFPRGISEVHKELETFQKLYPHLTIEKKFLIYYPLPTYFWFQNSAEGKVTARRVEEGFRILLKNGEYQKIFDNYYAANLAKLKLKKRQLIKLENPYLPATVPFKEKELWYDPFKD